MNKMNKMKKDIFKKRRQSKIIFLILISGIYIVASTVSGFENGLAFLSIPEGMIWLLKNFVPTQDSIKYIPIILKTAFDTVMLGVTATVISSLCALIMAVVGSETAGINRMTKISVKIIASFFRNIPLVAWSIILLFSFKQSEFTGLLALIFITFGYLTRTFMETIDEVAGDIIEALEATGASYFQIIFQGIIPSVSSQLVSWLLYFIENSVREVTLIGILTGTGIGFTFNMYYRSFKYDVAGLIILVIVIIVTSIELISNKIRKRLL